LIANGRKIDAISACAPLTDLGLKDAKEIADTLGAAIRSARGRTPPSGDIGRIRHPVSTDP
jgi:hypothetical protein